MPPEAPRPARATVLQQLATELEIGELQRLLGAAGIELLVLKGPHLGNTVYGDPLERPYCDLDVLVRPGEHARALSVLRAHGYQELDDGGGRSESRRQFYEVALRTPRRLRLELHRGFSSLDRYPIDVERLFERAVPFRIGRVTARGLGPEHLLVHLIVHVIGHYLQVEPKHYQDIAHLLAGVALDWDEVLAWLREAGATAGAYYVLLAVQRRGGAAVPVAALEQLRPGWLRRAWLDRLLPVRAEPGVQVDSRSPLCRQLLLALPLIDQVQRWPGLLCRYSRLRLLDLIASGGDASGLQPAA